jgi:hypothetical protein
MSRNIFIFTILYLSLYIWPLAHDVQLDAVLYCTLCDELCFFGLNVILTLVPNFYSIVILSCDLRVLNRKC